jgi:hypothetical protein
MATTDFLPTRESELVTWSTNFKTKITAAPTTYGLTAAQATAYTTLHNNFVTAYNTANDPLTRSPVNIIAKDTAKTALIANARMLARTVQGTSTVTAAQKEDLGLNPRSNQPSPIPPPASAPDIDIISTTGNTVKIRLHEAGEPTKRGKPAGVAGAAVFSFIGANPPTEMSDWNFEGLTTKTVLDIIFPAATSPGSKVWITAFWRNPRDQSGPAATPVTTNIPGGSAMAA